MTIKATAVIKKEAKRDPRRPNDISYYASVSLLNEHGKEYGDSSFFSSFPAVGDLLKREAGITHEQLHDESLQYDKGEEVRIVLTLENEEAITHMGFDPKAA